jgi:hypothetical protein
MMRDRDNLEAERQHIREKSGLDDLLRIDALLLAVAETAVEEAGDGTESLEVVRNARIVK